MTELSRKPQLIIHFDLNGTILLKDSSLGHTLRSAINALLAEATWGFISEEGLNKTKEERRVPDFIFLKDFGPSSSPPDASCISFGTYLYQHTSLPANEIRHIKNTFTEPGCIGEQFSSYFNQIYEKLLLPASIAADGPSYLKDGHRQIVPAFFRLFESLVAQDTFDFRIVFRTFGSDLSDVVEEINDFCKGKHPLYPSQRKYDGSDPNNPRDFTIILPHQSACFRRNGEDVRAGIQLSYINKDKLVVVARGASKVQEALMKELLQLTGYSEVKENRINYLLAIQDDFSNWERSDLKGKPLFVDPSIVQIFFDDCIERDRPVIVDARDASTLEPIPFNLSKDKYLVRAESFDFLLQEDYYIRWLQTILQTHYPHLPSYP